jgi:hypothetical protein
MSPSRRRFKSKATLSHVCQTRSPGSCCTTPTCYPLRYCDRCGNKKHSPSLRRDSRGNGEHAPSRCLQLTACPVTGLPNNVNKEAERAGSSRLIIHSDLLYCMGAITIRVTQCKFVVEFVEESGLQGACSGNPKRLSPRLSATYTTTLETDI